jgi:hypothetical protein
MDLLYLDNNPKKCAKHHNDKYIKSILTKLTNLLNRKINKKYISQLKYPDKWVFDSTNNYKYCLKLFTELTREYEHRFNKSYKVKDSLLNNLTNNLESNTSKLEDKPITEFELPDKFKLYHRFFNTDAVRYAYVDCENKKWSNRRKPNWFNKFTIESNKIKKKAIDNIKSNYEIIKKTNIDENKISYDEYTKILFDELFDGKYDTKIKSYYFIKKDGNLLEQLGSAHMMRLSEISNDSTDNKYMKELLTKFINKRENDTTFTKISRLTDDFNSKNYTRPEITMTDKLTEDDIKAKLVNYKRLNSVEELSKVALGTHIRYFDCKNDEYKFRSGGIIINNKGIPNYIVLSNGKNSWCAQIKTSIFFKRMNNHEIKEKYDKVLLEQTEKINKIKSTKQTKTIKYKKIDGNRINFNDIKAGDYIIITCDSNYKIYNVMYVYDVNKIKDKVIDIKTIDDKYEKYIFNNHEYTFYLTKPKKSSNIYKNVKKMKKIAI